MQQGNRGTDEEKFGFSKVNQTIWQSYNQITILALLPPRPWPKCSGATEGPLKNNLLFTWSKSAVELWPKNDWNISASLTHTFVLDQNVARRESDWRETWWSLLQIVQCILDKTNKFLHLQQSSSQKKRFQWKDRTQMHRTTYIMPKYSTHLLVVIGRGNNLCTDLLSQWPNKSISHSPSVVWLPFIFLLLLNE